MVERTADGACPAGHPPAALSGAIALDAEEPVPHLPRFSLAAFALPPVWGPVHGIWAGALFLPIWLFVDSILSTTGPGAASRAAGVAALSLTLGFQAFFAKRANGVAWRRASERMTLEEFVRRERRWALVCVPIGALLLGWGIYYRLLLS
jgi:hypothetical protein